MAKQQFIVIPEELVNKQHRSSRSERPLWKELRDLDRLQEVRDARKKPDGDKKVNAKETTYTFGQAFAFCVTFGLPIAFFQLLVGYGIVKIMTTMFTTP